MPTLHRTPNLLQLDVRRTYGTPRFHRVSRYTLLLLYLGRCTSHTGVRYRLVLYGAGAVAGIPLEGPLLSQERDSAPPLWRTGTVVTCAF